MGSLVHKTRVARDWLKVRHLGYASIIASLKLPAADFCSDGDTLIACRWDFRVPGSVARAFLLGYRSLLRLEERFTDTFNLTCAGECVVIGFNGLRMEARTWGDIDVLEEIFIDELYRFRSPGPVVVWDVGMNVGAASLYLAAQPQVTAVIGSELFKPTYERALRNFALNPTLASKITAHCEGVGDAKANLRLPYADELQGVVGLDGPLHTPEGVTTRLETVVIEAAPVLADRMRAQHPGTTLLLKMDCEGAEGRILRAMQSCGRLAEFALIIMEWHGRVILAEVEAVLQEAGFATTSMKFKGADVGSLSAFNPKALW